MEVNNVFLKNGELIVKNCRRAELIGSCTCISDIKMIRICCYFCHFRVTNESVAVGNLRTEKLLKIGVDSCIGKKLHLVMKRHLRDVKRISSDRRHSHTSIKLGYQYFSSLSNLRFSQQLKIGAKEKR